MDAHAAPFFFVLPSDTGMGGVTISRARDQLTVADPFAYFFLHFPSRSG